jgi:hypothetical protein
MGFLGSNLGHQSKVDSRSAGLGNAENYSLGNPLGDF